MPQFKSYNPKCQVLVRDLVTGDLLAELSDDVISLATNKAYGRCSGTWQIMLPYRKVKSWREPGVFKYYHQILQPDDIVTIEMDAGAGNGMQPVMLGLVDRASRVRQGENQPIRMVKVTGLDAGKLLDKHDIGWDISGVRAQATGVNQLKVVDQTDENKTNLKEVIQSNLARIALTAGTAEDLISQLLVIFFQTINPYLAYGMVDWKSTTDDTWKIWDPSLVHISGTSLWYALKSVAHEPWNTLHADTSLLDVNKFDIVLERTPITDTGKINRSQLGVDVHVINDADIITDDLGISDLERINTFCYWPTLYKQSVHGVVEIVLADNSLTKYAEAEGQKDNLVAHHGYCSKIIKDNFIPPNVSHPQAPEASTTGLTESAKRADIFWNWFKNNHNHESGSIDIHIRPGIRTGHCLVVRQEDDTYKEYLVEQVSNMYSVNPRPQAVTMLQVTRGQDAEPRKLS